MTPKPKTDKVEEIIKDFSTNIFPSINIGYDGGYYDAKNRDKYINWLRTTLETQADKTKRQHDIDVREAYAQGWNEGQQALTPKPPNRES